MRSLRSRAAPGGAMSSRNWPRPGWWRTLGDPAEIAGFRGPKKRAKTDRSDARLLRKLLVKGAVSRVVVVGVDDGGAQSGRMPFSDGSRPAVASCCLTRPRMRAYYELESDREITNVRN